VVCLVCGLAPALHVTRCDIGGALKGTRRLGDARLPLRSVLLAVQVAISVVLLVGAGLLVRGIQNARTRDVGFPIHDIVTVSFELPSRTYDPARARAFFTQLLRDTRTRLNDAPAALAVREPLSNSREQTSFSLPGERPDQQHVVIMESVTDGYFEVLRLPLLAGRGFTAADIGGPFVVINESMARRYWPEQNPVGNRFGGGSGPREIIGVVKDAYVRDLGSIEPLFYQAAIKGWPQLLVSNADLK